MQKKVTLIISIVLFLLTLTFSAVLASIEEHDIKAAGAKVRISSDDATNIYAAGADVSIVGKVSKNIWAAGALVNIDTETDGELHAAGSRINVKGKITGKTRLAAADLKIDAEIEDILNAAAANIEISEDTKLLADSSLAAALIEFRGVAKGNLNLYADEVVFSGQTSGSVTIEGRYVQLEDMAQIDGNLTIRSSEEAVISPNTKVSGKIIKTGLEDSEIFKRDKNGAESISFFLQFCASIFLLGLFLIIFTRDFIEKSISILRTQPGRSLLWGIAVLFGIPIFVVILMVSVIGMPIGLALLFLLPFLIILGFVTTTLGVSDWILNRNAEPQKIGQRILFLGTGVTLLAIIGFIPYIGNLVIFLTLLFGLGVAAVSIGRQLNGAPI